MDVPAGVTQEEGHTGFLIHLPSAVLALIFLLREGFSRPFPSSTAKSNFVYPRINRSPPPVRYYYYYHYYLKIPVIIRVTAPRLELTSSEGFFEVTN